MKKKILLILISIYLLLIKNNIEFKWLNNIFISQKRICVINMHNSQNVGNILVKFALFTKLKEFGFNATMVAPSTNFGMNLTFLNKTTNLFVINQSFSELNEKNYDYVMLNSDQTWRNCDSKYFYDIAFLKFAENWKIPKFIYGTSMGIEKWYFTKKDEEIAIKLLKNFTGISFREKGLIRLAEAHLGIKAEFVLDPTILIDKSYYLKEIENYNANINSSDKFVFVYQLDNNPYLEKTAKEVYLKYKMKIIKHKLYKGDYIESFIFGINNSQSVITDSFHGTIFSLIFDKPFITFLNSRRGKDRFASLNEVFKFDNRIIDSLENKIPNISLLFQPLDLNRTLLSDLKKFSIDFLRKNLGIKT